MSDKNQKMASNSKGCLDQGPAGVLDRTSVETVGNTTETPVLQGMPHKKLDLRSIS